MNNSVDKRKTNSGMGGIWLIIGIVAIITLFSLAKGEEVNEFVRENNAQQERLAIRNSSDSKGLNLNNWGITISDNYDQVMGSSRKSSNQTANQSTNDNNGTTKKIGKRYVTDDEFYWLTMLVCCEGGHEPRDGQIAIVATVLNRLDASYDGATSIADVIFAPYQYSCIWDWNFHLGESTVYYQDLIDLGIDVEAAEEAVTAALKGEDPTAAVLGGGAYYYYNPDCTYGDEYYSREAITNKIRIGNHVFYRNWN